MSKNYVNPCKVITGVNTRWSYTNVWKPKSINDGTPKYSVSLIIPKSDTKTIEKIRAAIKAAYEEGESKLKGNGRAVPALEAIKTPLRNGDLERLGDEAYKDSFLVNANSATKPGIVDADCLSWNTLKSTPASMAVRPSPSMPLTATAIKALPAD